MMIRSTNRTITTKTEKWEEKQQYGYFKRQTIEILHKKDLDMAEKGKPLKTNWISCNSSTKHGQKDELR